MSKSSVRWLFALSLGVSLGACKDEGEEQDTMNGDSGTGATKDGTSTGDVEDGTADESTGTIPPEVSWEFDPIYGVPNVDDDDENGSVDWFQIIFDGEDDHSTLEIPAVPAGYSALLRINGELEGVRVWHGNNPVLGSGDGETFEFDPGEGVPLDVEFGDDYVTASITAYLLDGSDAEHARALPQLEALRSDSDPKVARVAEAIFSAD